MPVTLAEAKLFMPEHVSAEVVDEYRKSSFLLDNMIFYDTVTPDGPVLTDTYRRLITQATAAFRAINAEYTPQEVTTAKYTVELKPFGGSFQVDRLLTRTAARNEVELNLTQKTKAAAALFHDTAINGDTAVDAASFDGLSKALVGTSTEVSATQVSADWRSSALAYTSAAGNEPAMAAIDLLESVIALMDGPPTAILGNSKSIPRFAAIAARAGFFDRSVDGFGRHVRQYGNVLLIDLGAKPGSTADIIPTATRTVIPLAGGAPASTTGLTDLYFVDMAIGGFNGVTLANAADMVQVYLDEFDPAYRQSGAVRRGEVEMVAAIELRRTRGAAVLRNIKVL